MSLADIFQFCPTCGAGGLQRKKPGALVCGSCGFVFYINAAPAVVVFLEDAAGKVLFIRRALDPQKGKLALPGGFVDAGERAEEALIREVREEVGLELPGVNYLTSFPNRYEFKGAVYDTLDVFYVGKADFLNQAKALDEVESIDFLRPEDIRPEHLAFVSQRKALEIYLATRKLIAGS